MKTYKSHLSTHHHDENNTQVYELRTRFPQRTGVRGVRVSVIITEVFGNIVACQLCHDVWDVSVRAQVLQPFVSTTWWRKI